MKCMKHIHSTVFSLNLSYVGADKILILVPPHPHLTGTPQNIAAGAGLWPPLLGCKSTDNLFKKSLIVKDSTYKLTVHILLLFKMFLSYINSLMKLIVILVKLISFLYCIVHQNLDTYLPFNHKFHITLSFTKGCLERMTKRVIKTMLSYHMC